MSAIVGFRPVKSQRLPQPLVDVHFHPGIVRALFILASRSNLVTGGL